jgi:hypothetical protein
MRNWFGMILQLIGMLAVGICLINGLIAGDYGRRDLFLFILGPVMFYLGHFLRKSVYS